MNNQHATTSPQPAARSPRRAFLVRAAPLVLLLLVALLPRLLDLGLFVTDDEINFWLDRSELFLNALSTGDFAATAISTHPGVTTMWLGSAGIVLRRTLRALELVPEISFPLLLALMRLPGALLHTGAILAGYGLLRRLLPPAVALLAALLWAADPFVIGYSRLLHVDALMSTFATLSILAACCFWHHQRHPSLLVLSAACGALAVLSKSPGLIVLPVIAAIALWDTLASRPRRSLRAQAAALALWGAVFVALLVLAWPAVWAAPGQVYAQLAMGVEGEGAQPHMTGNFFLGRPVEVPGLLFYPAAAALRTTPLTLPGLLLLLPAWRGMPLSSATRRDLLTLAGFAILFIAAMSYFPKQFNRYLVPIFPALDMLAAVGLVWAIEWLARIGRQKRLMADGLLALVAALAVVNTAWWHPYEIMAFNQMLGGAKMGVQTFSVGWGEGLNLVADWLNRQPDSTGVVTASIKTPNLNPYLRHGAQATTPRRAALPDKAGYVVVYIYQVQGTLFPPFDQFYRRAVPLHTVTIHGVDYAWIYQVPPPVQHRLDAPFGSAIHLRGYEVESAALQSTGVLSLTVQWQAVAPVEQDYMLFAHILDSSGQRVGQADAPPAGEAAPTGDWQPWRYQTWTHPLPVQANLPPGNYWLALGLYDPQDFTRLPLQGTAPAGAPDAGDNALLLSLTLP